MVCIIKVLQEVSRLAILTRIGHTTHIKLRARRENACVIFEIPPL
jgi:hypothetical protein